MTISRDEAREIAIVALLVTIGMRIGAGVFQVIDDLGHQSDLRALTGRLFTPIGSTIGIMTLGAMLLVVLSPAGSVTTGVVTATRRIAGLVAAMGIGASFHTIVLGYSQLLAKLWFAMINGLAAATLGAAAYWVLRNFDGNR